MSTKEEPLEILCFGCIGQPGHYLRSPTSGFLSIKTIPWGASIDGGLLSDKDTNPDGKWVRQFMDGWTAVSFWDRSGDHRAGSNTSFLVHADMAGEAVLYLAQFQWPEVFNRPGFPIKLTVRSCSKCGERLRGDPSLTMCGDCTDANLNGK